MRSPLLTTLALFLTVGALLSADAVVAGPDAAPTAGDVAEWIRAGTEDDLAKAVAASSSMDATRLRQVIVEVRDQTRIHGALERRLVRGLRWDSLSMDRATGQLRTITGLNFFVTPKGVTASAGAEPVTHQFDEASVAVVLDTLAKHFGLDWCVRQGVVMLHAPAELGRAPAAAPAAAGADGR